MRGAALLGLDVNGTGVANNDRSEWFPRLDVDDGRDVVSRPPLRADRLGVAVPVVEAREGVSRIEEAREDALEGVSLVLVDLEEARLMSFVSSSTRAPRCST